MLRLDDYRWMNYQNSNMNSTCDILIQYNFDYNFYYKNHHQGGPFKYKYTKNIQISIPANANSYEL